MARDGALRLAVRVSPRSTTTVDGADVGLTEHDAGRQLKDGEMSGRCPLTLPVTSPPQPAAAERQTPSIDVKPMHELNGPVGWPIVGNFLTYLKKENQGKMHEVQVSATL